MEIEGNICKAHCGNCNTDFEYSESNVIIECGYKGIRCPKCGNWIYHNAMNEDTKSYVERMRKCESEDTECAHIEADKILCELVEKYVPNGAEIVKAFNELYKWYA